MSDTSKNWQDDLFDKVEEMLADTKQVKFNTHKNRKIFFGKLKSMVIAAVEANTRPMQVDRHSTPMITHPNPNKSQGFAVMHEGLSQQADALNEAKVVAKPERQQRVNTGGLRSW